MVMLHYLRTLIFSRQAQTLSNFTKAMAEALEQQAKSKDSALSSNISKNAHKSRYTKSMKKRLWESGDEKDAKRIKETSEFERVKRKKHAVLLGYSGVGYYGMQRNPDMKTIEEELLTAMLKNNFITEEAFKQPQVVGFQRAARTDKGVSAVRQCVSLKLPRDMSFTQLNINLPEQIRVFAIQPVTKGFNSKDQCDSRTYTYTLPTIAFSDYKDDTSMNEYRIPLEKLNHLSKVLNSFEGTKNFHNFTSRKLFIDPSAKRFILHFICRPPFIGSSGVEFATLEIKGQSFMLHQIRKMIGLTLAVLRGHTSMDTIEKCFKCERMEVPMAPGLGLVLDRLHYGRYNQRYGNDGVHEELTWDKIDGEVEEFAEKFIYATIYEVEIRDRPMMEWLKTLGFHTYDVREQKSDVTETACISNIQSV